MEILRIAKTTPAPTLPITHVDVRLTAHEVLAISHVFGCMNVPTAKALGVHGETNLHQMGKNAGIPTSRLFTAKGETLYLVTTNHAGATEGYLERAKPATTPLARRVKAPAGADAEHEMIDADTASEGMYRQFDTLRNMQKQCTEDRETIRQLQADLRTARTALATALKERDAEIEKNRKMVAAITEVEGILERVGGTD